MGMRLLGGARTVTYVLADPASNLLVDRVFTPPSEGFWSNRGVEAPRVWS